MDNFKTKDNLKLWFVNKSLKMLTKNKPSHCQRPFAHIELWEGCYREQAVGQVCWLDLARLCQPITQMPYRLTS